MSKRPSIPLLLLTLTALVQAQQSPPPVNRLIKDDCHAHQADGVKPDIGKVESPKLQQPDEDTVDRMKTGGEMNLKLLVALVQQKISKADCMILAHMVVEALLMLLVATGASWAQVTVPSLSASSNQRSDFYARDASVVDHFIPVITMEQFYSGQTQLQGYRVQVFKDGRGVYHGLKNVKTLGEVRFRLTPEQVQRMLNEFSAYRFWDVPEDQYGLPKGMGILTLQFTLRDANRTKTVRFGGERHAGILQHVLETEVNSARWRCPFEDEDSRDPCRRLVQYLERVVPIFLENDLPKLLETYR